MKEYGDEAFIYEMVHKNDLPKYEGNDIRNGVAYVDGNSISFCEQCIIENRLYMTIPAEFDLLPAWMIKKLHPYDNRPDKVFSENEKLLKSMNYWIEGNLPNDTETEQVLEQILIRTNPAHKIVNTILVCNFFELTLDGVGETRIGHFELVTANDGKEISDFVFFFPLDEKYVVGSFKCISVDLPEWMDTVIQMLNTLRIT